MPVTFWQNESRGQGQHVTDSSGKCIAVLISLEEWGEIALLEVDGDGIISLMAVKQRLYILWVAPVALT
jgi:hypothetical protein